MDKPGPDHFEMRRLESLSSTIFRVAMTLLAYDLPRAAQFSALLWPGNHIQRFIVLTSY